MNKSKNKKTGILLIVLLALLIIGYKVMFPSAGDVLISDEQVLASQKVESILKEVESISFDTSVLQDLKSKSFVSLETPLVSLPVGKKNPFAAVSN